jgi:hypothetical protein
VEPEFTDKFGNVLNVGDKVIRAYRTGNRADIEIRHVERIANGKMYLDGAKGSYVQNFDNLVKWDK